MYESERVERRIINHLLTTAHLAGWIAKEVNDGGDDLVPCASIQEAMDAVFAVDDCTICFHRVTQGRTKRLVGVYIVLGNGIDCICDYTVDAQFESEVMEVSNAFVESLEVA